MPRRWTEKELALPDGSWRIDPFTRVLRFVPDDPNADQPDAFDEPFVEPKVKPRKVKTIEHGTYSGYRLHRRRGEKGCKQCRMAEQDYKAKRAQARYAEGDPLFTCECGAFKQRASHHCKQCAITLRWSKTTRKAA